jgi:hypothetical protein
MGAAPAGIIHASQKLFTLWLSALAVYGNWPSPGDMYVHKAKKEMEKRQRWKAR